MSASDPAATDIIDLIDQVTAPTCASCGKPLRPDGPSQDFCGEDCAGQWHNPAADVPLAADPPDSGRIDYPLPNGRALTVRFTREFTTDQWSPVCQVSERFPTGDKFVWYMDRAQWADLSPDPEALAMLWDCVIRAGIPRASDGSWDITEQRPPWAQPESPPQEFLHTTPMFRAALRSDGLWDITDPTE